MSQKTLILDVNNQSLKLVNAANLDKTLETLQKQHASRGYSGILSLEDGPDANTKRLVSSIPDEKPVRASWQYALITGRNRILSLATYANQGAARSAAEGMVNTLAVERVELTSGETTVKYIKGEVKQLKTKDDGTRDWYPLVAEPTPDKTPQA